MHISLIVDSLGRLHQLGVWDKHALYTSKPNTFHNLSLFCSSQYSNIHLLRLNVDGYLSTWNIWWVFFFF